ncbi:MAG: VCBS repeat-containing protein [Planctomycetota bacterium]
MLVWIGAFAWADEVKEEPRFKAPERLPVGENRYYPSPVMHDLDGDGKPELIVGDLRGMVTMSKMGALADEKPVLMADGKPLKFQNW